MVTTFCCVASMASLTVLLGGQETKGCGALSPEKMEASLFSFNRTISSCHGNALYYGRTCTVVLPLSLYNFLSLLFLRCDDVVCWMMAKYSRPWLLRTVWWTNSSLRNSFGAIYSVSCKNAHWFWNCISSETIIPATGSDCETFFWYSWMTGKLDIMNKIGIQFCCD